MRPHLVIFDLDGTLVNTVADLGTAVNFALQEQGLPVHPLEAYKQMVGHGVRNLVQRAMPEALRSDIKLWDSLLAVFMDYYRAHLTDLSRPYPGIPELLARLQGAGLRLAVASNKFQDGTEAVVRTLFPEVAFDLLCGVREGFPLKPDPAVVQAILAHTGIPAQAAVLVGDSGTDMRTARAAGIPGIAVAWGFQPTQAQALCDVFVHSVKELERELGI